LDKDEAPVWHQAAAALPALPATLQLTDAEVDALRQQVSIKGGQLPYILPQ
jgi:hypothetical protein